MTDPRAILAELQAPSQQAAARFLGVDPSTMRRWIARGRFPPEVEALWGVLRAAKLTIPQAMAMLGRS